MFVLVSWFCFHKLMSVEPLAYTFSFSCVSLLYFFIFLWIFPHIVPGLVEGNALEVSRSLVLVSSCLIFQSSLRGKINNILMFSFLSLIFIPLVKFQIIYFQRQFLKIRPRSCPKLYQFIGPPRRTLIRVVGRGNPYFRIHSVLPTLAVYDVDHSLARVGIGTQIQSDSVLMSLRNDVGFLDLNSDSIIEIFSRTK